MRNVILSSSNCSVANCNSTALCTIRFVCQLWEMGTSCPTATTCSLDRTARHVDWVFGAVCSPVEAVNSQNFADYVPTAGFGSFIGWTPWFQDAPKPGYKLGWPGQGCPSPTLYMSSDHLLLSISANENSIHLWQYNFMKRSITFEKKKRRLNFIM